MVFSSPLFLFLFLPLTLFAVLAVRKELRNMVLLLASLVFYAWGEGEIVVLMLLSIFMNYLFGLWIGACTDKRRAKLYVAGAVVVNFGLLAVFKYANFVVDQLNPLLLDLGLTPFELAPIHLPIGISFFTFHAMSYVIDVYRKEAVPQRSFINMALYISLFPQLVAGPIIRYHDVARQLIHRVMSVEKFSSGTQRFVLGLAKKMLLANTFAAAADGIFAVPAAQLTSGLAWLGGVCYMLQIYYDFSGYSDMAIGLGRMFGFEFLENFNFPYVSRSIKEFWRRWHISLSNWFRDYLYIPLGGNRVSPARMYVNLLLVFFLTGLWHGASWTFILWGLYHGFFLVLERLGFERFMLRLWRPISHIYTLLVVLVGWVFFRADDIGYASEFLRAMFMGGRGLGVEFSVGLYANNKLLLALAAGLLLSAPVYGALRERFSVWSAGLTGYKVRVARAGSSVLSYLMLMGLLVLCSMSLASNTYNPFIYFRF